MGALPNSIDPDEMPHNCSTVLTVRLDKIDIQRKKYNIFEIISRVPSIYRMDHPDFIVYSLLEYSISMKRVNNFHASGDFCRLLTTLANCIIADEVRQMSVPILIQTF